VVCSFLYICNFDTNCELLQIYKYATVLIAAKWSRSYCPFVCFKVVLFTVRRSEYRKRSCPTDAMITRTSYLQLRSSRTVIVR